MTRIVFLSTLLMALSTKTSSHPHLYNPYYSLFRYSDPYYHHLGDGYGNRISPLPPAPFLQDPVLTAYAAVPGELPTLNVLAEAPYLIKKDFTVVPMLVMAEENMRLVSDGDIMGVSRRKPIMTVKAQDTLLQCTPAVRIVLKTPIVVYSLRSSIVFPSEIDIIHGRYTIPITVGAVIAPVPQATFVSTQTPITLDVVYAVPTRPIRVHYVNYGGNVLQTDLQSVVVNSEHVEPPRNVTFITFPEKLAEPVLTVDEEDAELDYRQPPVVLAPAGIASSSQPNTFTGPFINSKESPILTTIRDEALKHRLYN